MRQRPNWGLAQGPLTLAEELSGQQGKMEETASVVMPQGLRAGGG